MTKNKKKKLKYENDSKMKTTKDKEDLKIKTFSKMRMISKIENDPKINNNSTDEEDLKMKTIQRHTAIPFVALHYFFSLIIL